MFFLRVLEKAKHYFLSSRRKVRSTHEQSMFINTLQYDFKFYPLDERFVVHMSKVCL